jgi:hypothetical protein
MKAFSLKAFMWVSFRLVRNPSDIFFVGYDLHKSTYYEFIAMLGLI